MKKLSVPHTPHLQYDSSFQAVSAGLRELPRQYIEIAPWSSAESKPEVFFRLSHHEDCLFLQYQVREKTIRARYRNINDEVYKDSCVEFFIAFGEDTAYYNLEANCLGTCRVGYGKNKYDRKLLPANVVSEIRSFANLRVAANGQESRTWELTLIIPASVFTEHRLTTFAGLQGTVNFYKCGDDLPEPHFLVWHPIEAPEPNFHRPDHFGEIEFLTSIQ